MTLTSGTKLGRYEIRSKIGEGGIGEVYLAREEKLEPHRSLHQAITNRMKKNVQTQIL